MPNVARCIAKRSTLRWQSQHAALTDAARCVERQNFKTAKTNDMTNDMTRQYTMFRKITSKYLLFLVLLLMAAGAKAQTEITSLSQITDPAGNYKLTANISGGSGLNIAFTGTLDGDYHTISGLSAALFSAINGGTVKNLILSNVSVSGGTNAGAIANIAAGNSKIYNCGVLSGSVSGSGAVGGLVGQIQASSNVRVVNCYNYATISGGTYAAGIVGQNAGTISGTTTVNATGVRITNCMMYGDITSGTNRSPVYGGNHTNNVQKLTEYNYYRSRAKLTYTAYNDQLAIGKDEFLTRFPFYRHIQNTHREMAAYFLFGAAPTAAQVAEIGHWVLKTDVAPYPIIEKWQTNTKKTLVDRANNLPNTSEDYAGKLLMEMGNNGYLTVNVSINGSSFTSQLPITDMDTLRYDFTWGKVVLPFANEFEGWARDYSKICTGWRITNVGGQTTFSIPTGEPYNFADRDNKQKDIYDATKNPYVFAQGGNYIVPYGVTSISIEANFANAFYLSDAQADFGYNASYQGQTNLAWAVPATYHGQTVYTSLTTLMGALSASTNPNTQAIVLVGNYHYNQAVVGQVFNNNTGKAVTIMSVDEDNNQEPDYGWYSYHSASSRQAAPPLRFDFVPNIGIGMAQRVNGSAPYPTIGIWNTRGWFELTETTLSLMNECESEDGNFTANDNGYGNNRWIANSGYFLEFVRGFNTNATKLSYVQIGGNAYVEKFYPGGPHFSRDRTSTLRPIVVTGGEIEECFMTGRGKNSSVTATGANIYFWCAGGRIHKWLGSYLVKPSDANCKVTAKIDHARILRFFGGGTSDKAPVTGDIDITINNSLVDFFCGGPEFGDMKAGRTVTTHATGTTFGEFYGGGYGGTAITYVNYQDQTVTFGAVHTFNGNWSYYTSHRLEYDADNGGFGSCYSFDFIPYSGGTGSGVSRFYTGYADFSLATTGNVTNVLEDCIVKRNFYGGGCQGKVNGTVTSTLTNCSLEGSAFGGGFKPAETTVDVYPTTQPTYSVYTRETGVFSDFGTVEPEIFTWQFGTAGTLDEANKILYTAADLSSSGQVTGNISITVDGGTVGGNVFGGGNESPSRSNTEVIIKGDVEVTKDVFGGGNIANVDGSTTVDIQGGTVQTDVYGGGALANTGSTTVNLSGGTIVHDVYGGGLGQKTGFFGATSDVEALVNGNTLVELNKNNGEGGRPNTDNCVVLGSIFGCNNRNGTPTGAALVHVYKTTGNGSTNVRTPSDKLDSPVASDHKYELTAVYGGGNMSAYEPTASDGYSEVIIDGCGVSSINYVYGGGNAASVPATKVTVYGSYEIGNVFGGGNGLDNLPNGDPNPGANVGYHAYEFNGQTGAMPEGASAPEPYGTGVASVSVYGGTVHNVFGGSNTKGNVRETALAYLDEGSDCPLKIDGIYGGGNAAYMSGNAQIKLGCVSSMSEIYGGAKQADVGNDVVLTITSGHFDRVFGGNNISGEIDGSITVNIEETGCYPITIGELYGCGNRAPYVTPAGKTHPTLNIKSFTSIGRVFGGGLGAGAVVTGNPTVNINEVVGDNALKPSTYAGTTLTLADNTTVALPAHESGKMGSIGSVFGGGNEAEVRGNTTVKIGTLSTVDYESKAEGETEPRTNIFVLGADIVGNVFGGGNNAEVTGNCVVVVGKGTE